MRHLEHVEKDVEVIAPVGAVIEQSLRAVRRIEDALGRVAELLEQVPQTARVPLPRDEVEVRIVAPERGPRLLGRTQPDRYAADQAQREPLGRRLGNEPAALLGQFGRAHSGGISWKVRARSIPWLRR